MNNPAKTETTPRKHVSIYTLAFKIQSSIKPLFFIPKG